MDELDLDAIEAQLVDDERRVMWRTDLAVLDREDVLALVAEVRRLREALAMHTTDRTMIWGATRDRPPAP
jgi:hypothetical protein